MGVWGRGILLGRVKAGLGVSLGCGRGSEETHEAGAGEQVGKGEEAGEVAAAMCVLGDLLCPSESWEGC